jgi:pseudaminic acid biosynthesis-associated methylase
MEQNPQEMWDGEFGEEYTDRNKTTIEEVNSHSEEAYDISKIERLERFLGDINRDANVLEVGSNIGTQLMCLREIGFENLYGIDVQRKAIEEAHQQRPKLDIIEGDALDIPFKDGFFDLVFTSGVLIHIPPEDINSAMNEITRCTSKWVYGTEYYAEEYTEVNYRGHENLLWKTDFPSLFQDNCDLELVDVEHREDSTYSGETIDVEYLLQKPE